MYRHRDQLTTQPFPEAILDILLERDMSQRELARRAQAKSDTGYPHLTTINSAILGEIEPSMNLIEALAKGLNISPRRFTEYELARTRNSLDPKVVGFATARRNLLRLGK